MKALPGGAITGQPEPERRSGDRPGGVQPGTGADRRGSTPSHGGPCATAGSGRQDHAGVRLILAHCGGDGHLCPGSGSTSRQNLQLQPALLLQKIDEHFLPYFFARAGL